MLGSSTWMQQNFGLFDNATLLPHHATCKFNYSTLFTNHLTLLALLATILLIIQPFSFIFHLLCLGSADLMQFEFHPWQCNMLTWNWTSHIIGLEIDLDYLHRCTQSSLIRTKSAVLFLLRGRSEFKMATNYYFEAHRTINQIIFLLGNATDRLEIDGVLLRLDYLIRTIVNLCDTQLDEVVSLIYWEMCTTRSQFSN